jgi:peroxiredoxin
MQERRPPAWTKIVLIAAAAYHVCWGAWVVLFPDAGLRLLQMPDQSIPEIWQCVGMMVAVYGIGYAIAARDPFRHWPIVLVGLIGKVLGPIVLWQGVRAGRFPIEAGWTILTNDAIWWAPFGLILHGAWEANLGRRRDHSPEVLRFALAAKTDTGITIEQFSRLSPVLLVFLRHAGCTFCRQALADISQQRRRIERAGASIVLVHMGPPEPGIFGKYGLDDLPTISDPDCSLYRAFGLKRGTLPMLLGPRVWWRGFQAAILDRHGVGTPLGDAFQMPGIFLIFHGEVLRSFRHQSAADRPDYVRFVRVDESSEKLTR